MSLAIESHHRVAVLLHGGIRGDKGKTGLALLRYGQFEVVAAIDQETAGDSLKEITGIPRAVPIVPSVVAALAYRPDVLAIGIAPSGGNLPEAWHEELQQAIANGLSIVNGLHTPLASDPTFAARLQPGQWIWDVRREPPGLQVGSGAARMLSAQRVLTVGTDMGVGKMSTSLELHRLSQQRGLRSRFVGTGQTGIMLAGTGVALDAVRVDFASGAVEQSVVTAGTAADIVHIEGQGSLLNPASTATLPLIRGSQPTHLVLVHRAGQTHIRNFDHVPIPPLRDVVTLYEAVATAAGAFAPAAVVAIALNTAHLDSTQVTQAITQVMQDTGLPCTDPVRFGAAPILDAIS
jgi:uncharacterized NAD-dependent epimerase/dehydratase family protein